MKQLPSSTCLCSNKNTVTSPTNTPLYISYYSSHRYLFVYSPPLLSSIPFYLLPPSTSLIDALSSIPSTSLINTLFFIPSTYPIYQIPHIFKDMCICPYHYPAHILLFTSPCCYGLWPWFPAPFQHLSKSHGNSKPRESNFDLLSSYTRTYSHLLNSG